MQGNKMDKFDTIEDLNKFLLETDREVMQQYIFSYTRVDRQTGYPVQFPLFYVWSRKPLIAIK